MTPPLQPGDHVLSLGQGSIRENVHRLIEPAVGGRYWRVEHAQRNEAAHASFIPITPASVIRLSPEQVERIFA